jgi:hypothetical protein
MKFLTHLLLITSYCAVLLAADAKPGADVLGRWGGGKWIGEGQFVDSD